MVPFQSADFLLVANEFAQPLIRLPHVTMVYDAISRTRREDVFVPRKGADSSGVAHHCSQATLGMSIPNLYLAFICANCDVRAALYPVHTGYGIVLQFTKLCHTATARIPHVNAGS
jgi:hypothetical protein